MDQDLYDEFGNYIGPEVDESDEEGSEEEEEEEPDEGGEAQGPSGPEGALAAAANGDGAIVLHEDKNYYPEADEVYPGVNTVLLDEDAQDLTEPLLKPTKAKNFSVLAHDVPELVASPAFIASMVATPGLARHVAVVGHFHSGKTALLDLLVAQTHAAAWDPTKDVRYTDSRVDEQARELSVKSCPVSLVLPSSAGKHFLLNLVDCPGHPNFSDECAAGMRAADGVVLVVDALEGVMLGTSKMVEMAMLERLPLTLVLNKVDRLILELKLPPTDAYHKLVHTIEEVNALVAQHWAAGAGGEGLGGPARAPRLSPERGNVCFASSAHGWCFSLQSFAKVYTDFHQQAGVSAKELSLRLWGDAWLDPQTRTFVKAPPTEASSGGAPPTPRTFVQYILEPLYKLYSACLSEEPETLSRTLRDLGTVALSKPELHLDPKPLLRLVLGRFFGDSGGFVDMVAKHVPSPLGGAANKVEHAYSGAASGAAAAAMRACDPTGPLLAHVVKLYSAPDGHAFHALARVYSGTLRPGARVKVLGEGYTLDDEEDAADRDVLGLALPEARFTLDLAEAPAGCLVLVQGVDGPINKTATLTAAAPRAGQAPLEVEIFRPLSFNTAAVIKLAVEPLNPAELPKMVEALRRISKSYPLCTTKVEESGEHVVLGTGELYLDCVMHDLRRLYSDVEVKVADPVTCFCETVVDTSALKCVAETPNKRNQLTMVAEPLEDGLADDIEQGRVSTDWDRKQLGEFFQAKYDWDLLTARSVWAFGPGPRGPNVLVDDTLPSEVDKKLLAQVRGAVVQGFQWGCREGPLCDEPVRNAKFKILDAALAAEPIHRGGGQVIPTARRCAYSAFLMATPRLMEPVLELQIQAPADVVQSIFPVLARRRGHVVQDAPKPGAPFYTVKAYLPAMDSFGFETDLRAFTQGQAMCFSTFDHWSIVPGDPLDRSVVLHPLEPSLPQSLARDFMVKTRRRKGLSEDVSVAKFFDDPMLLELAKQQQQQAAAMGVGGYGGMAPMGGGMGGYTGY